MLDPAEMARSGPPPTLGGCAWYGTLPLIYARRETRAGSPYSLEVASGDCGGGVGPDVEWAGDCGDSTCKLRR